MTVLSAPLIARAEALARELHAGQQDRAGRPYVEHLTAVVGILLRRWPDAPEEAVAAAWLHDALGLPDADHASVHQLGRRIYRLIKAGMPGSDDLYAEHMVWLGTFASPWAIRIKLADLEHNCDPARALPDSTLVERRYRPAIAVLEAALARREGRVG